MPDPTNMRPARQARSGGRNTPSARAVGDLLGQTDALASLRAGVRQVAALERDLGAILPDYLAPHVTVGTIKGEILTIFAGHSALAARLRHLERGLVQSLQQRGWPISSFKVKVKPEPAREAHVKQARVSAVGVQCLSSLADSLEPSPLRDALERMVARHTGNTRK
jgi:hypothetical protein